MARTRYTFLDNDQYPYFITATSVNWLPVFSNPEIAGILLDSLRYLITHQQLKLIAYVLMENHVHLIAASPNLPKNIATFKSYTARASIDHYQARGNHFLLDQLAVAKLAHKTDRTHQFWQEGSHPQRMENQAVLEQKINYIHHNPVKRGYVDLPEHWRYSSARNYAGQTGLLPIAGIDTNW